MPFISAHFRSPSARVGISLLEVLISMFVMLIGMLGIAALLPAGRFDAAAGVQLNRAGETGRAALRQLHIDAMLHAYDAVEDSWQQMSTSTTSPLFPVPGVNALLNTVPFDPSHNRTWYYNSAGRATDFKGRMEAPLVSQIRFVLSTASDVLAPDTSPPVPSYPAFYPGAFCIDPLPILTAASQANDTNVNNVFTFPPTSALHTQTPIGFLPGLPSSSPYYYRLCTMPRVLPMHSVWTMSGAATLATQLSQSLAIADAGYRSNDDIVIVPPKRSDDAATQQFNGANLKRAAEGKYSWLATVNRIDIGDSRSPWNVAVAVFLNRLLPPDNNEDGVPAERTVYVPTIYGGSGGGEVVLQATGSTDTNLLKLKRGQWILLCQMGFIPPKSGNPNTWANWQFIPPRWNWYKVIAADDAIIGGSGYAERNVSLTGPDLNTAAGSATGPYWYTTAAIADNVIAVYEKEIKLEEDSDWAAF